MSALADSSRHEGRGTVSRRARRRTKRLIAGIAALALTPLFGAALPTPLAPVASANHAAPTVTLTPMGSNALASFGLDGLTKNRGQHGDVATVGNTAFVGAGTLFSGVRSSAGRICTDHGGVKVVDVSNPSAPVVTNTITVSDLRTVAQGPVDNPRRGTNQHNVSNSVSALDAIRHPLLNKDVLAIATQRCEQDFFGGARVEFWDVTTPTTPVLMTYYDGTAIDPLPANQAAWGIIEDVNLFTKNDGPGGTTQVYAAITAPFSVGNVHNATKNGDFRILNVSTLPALPAQPAQVMTFPSASMGSNTNNGCRIFSGGRNAMPTPDGKSAIFSFYDGLQPHTSPISPTGLSGNLDPADPNDDNPNSAAVMKIDFANTPVYDFATAPGGIPPVGQYRSFTPTPKSWGYPAANEGGMNNAGNQEGNASDVQPFNGPNGELMTFVSEEDVDPSLTNVTITSPAFDSPAPNALPGSANDTRGCESLVGKKLFESPLQQVAGDVVYVGRACPKSNLANDNLPVDDPLLASPAGKIALVDGGGGLFNGCSITDKIKRLAADGATAVISSLGCCPTLTNAIMTGEVGVNTIPYVGLQYRQFNQMTGYIPNRVVGSAGATTFPAAWNRSTTTNVTVRQRSFNVAAVTSSEHFTNGASTNGSATFTSATAAFVGTDVGKSITSNNATTGVATTTIPAGATISAVVNATTVTLSANATATLTGVDFTIVNRGLKTNIRTGSKSASTGAITPAANNLVNGDTVSIYEVPTLNGPATNGNHVVTVTSASGFSLNASAVPAGPSLNGGEVVVCPPGAASCAAQRADLSRYRSVANATDRVASGNPNPVVVTTTAAVTMPPQVPAGEANPNITIPVQPLPGAIPAQTSFANPVSIRFSNGVQVIPTAAAAIGATSITVQSGFPDSIDGNIPSGTTGSIAGGVVAGRSYDAGVDLEMERYGPTGNDPAGTAGAFEGNIVWYDAAGAVISRSTLGSVNVKGPRARFNNGGVPVVAPAGAVRMGSEFRWTGAGPPVSEGTAYADTFSFTPTGLAVTLKDLPGRCSNLTAWPPTPAMCSDPGPSEARWGSQKIIDFSQTIPTQVGSYESPNSKTWPPPDDGIYRPSQARMFGNDIAFTTWMSDGLRVLDMTNPAAPTLAATYIPAGVADPTPGAGAGTTNRRDGSAIVRGPSWPTKPLVTGVDIIPIDQRSGYAVLSDINAGLSVVHFAIGNRHTDGLYHAITPARILDTRAGINTGVCTPSPCAKLGDAGNPNTIELQVTGQGGVPASAVSSVKMNVTVTGPANSAAFLKVYPCDATLPVASNLNYTTGQTVPNLVTVKLSTGTGNGCSGPGRVKITNNAGDVNVIGDIAGWYGDDTVSTGSRYNSLVPSRVLDTRVTINTGSCTPSPCAKLGADGNPNTIDVQVTGIGEVPATGVTGVIMNVTATNVGGGAQFMTVYPSDAALPTASNLNYTEGQTVPNLVAVKVGPTGKVKITNNEGSVDVIGDVAGWFGVDTVPVGGRFQPLPPARILDTRVTINTGVCTPSPCARLGSGGNPNTIDVQVAGQGGVPATGASSVIVNVTAVTPGGTAAYLKVYPSNAALPTASNLNYVTGQIVPNLVAVKLGPDGKVKVTNDSGDVDVIFDVAGWYKEE